MADSNRWQNSEVSTMSNMMGKYFTGKRILKVLVIFFCLYKYISRDYKLLFYSCQISHNIISQNPFHFTFSGFCSFFTGVCAIEFL